MIIKKNPFPDEVLIYCSKGLDAKTRISDNLCTADVAELADAQASGACALRGVEVRVLSSALFFAL
jgi:hypothetical protein